MTYQMTRARLISIGDPAARFRDLTIPLCDDDGNPVDSLVWLRNGGGKTSLESLLLALVLPLRDDFMGNSDQQRSLEEYIQTGDTSHVVIEWADPAQPVLPGFGRTRLITGMVHEWAGRTAPADRDRDKDKLATRYYSFTAVHGTMTLDTLPIRGEQGLNTLAAFVESLRSVARGAAGALNFEVFRGAPHKWADHLDEQLSIDPGLFRYQAKMNASEGAVAKLFRFRSAREFIEFLVSFTAAQTGTGGETLKATTNTVRSLLESIARQPALRLERHFSASVATRMQVLADAGTAHTVAAEHAATTRGASNDVAATLVAAGAKLREHAEDVEENGRLAAEEATRLGTERRRRQDEAAEYAHVGARLAAAEADAVLALAQDDVKAAGMLDVAWRLVDTLAEADRLDGEIETLRAQCDSEDEERRPLREAHDRTARALRSRLTRQIRAENDHAADLRAQVSSLDKERERAQRDIQSHAKDAAAASATAATRRRESGHLRREVEATLKSAPVLDWILHPDTHAVSEVRVDLDAVSKATDAARAEAEASKQESLQARAKLDSARARNAGAQADERAARDFLAEQSEKRRRADEKLGQAIGAIEELAADVRLRELAGAEDSDTLDLQAAGSTLVRRLRDLASNSLAGYATAQAEQANHSAVVAAIDDAGYVTASPDALAALGILTSAGLDACSGWAYLRENLPPERVPAVLANDTVVALAAGVVVPANELERARTLLLAKRASTAALVPVSDPAAYSAALVPLPDTDLRAGSGLLGRLSLPGRVPTDPAVHDRAAAAEAKHRHSTQAEVAGQRGRDLRTSSEADQRLADKLRTLLEDYPPRVVEQLRADADAAASAAEAAAEAHTAASTLQEEIGQQVENLVDVVERAGKYQRVAERAGDLLSRACADLSKAAEHDLQAEGEDHLAQEAATHQSAAEDELAALLKGLEAARTRATAALHAVGTLTSERDDVAFTDAQTGAEGPQNGDAQDGDWAGQTADALEYLRSAYQAARQSWARVSAASDVESQLQDRRLRRTELESRLSADEQARATARDLLAGPDGSSPQLRRAATLRTAKAVSDTAAALGTAKANALAAQSKVAAAAPADRPRHANVPSSPTSPAEAQQLETQAREEAAALGTRIERATEVAQDLNSAVAQLRQCAERVLSGVKMLPSGTSPADGVVQQQLLSQLLTWRRVDEADAQGPSRTGAADLNDVARVAEAAATTARDRQDTAFASATQAHAKLAAADTAVRRMASAVEFRDIPVELRGWLEEDLTVLAGRAGQLMHDLTQRSNVITSKLAKIDEDSDTVLRNLSRSARDVLADLRKAERFARMPAGTGSWSNRSFLTIRCGSDPDEETLRARLSPVLERFAADPKSLNPMRLLKDCVVAAAGGPQVFRVRVLKPNAPGTELEDITRLQKFSGGEKLTVCVALFCVLARLRAANVGRAGGGTLLLDNPLGTASHTELLSLQRAVAGANDVQLVFASGVNDLGAVGEFPHIARLRNVARVGTNRRSVEHDAGITSAHVGRHEPHSAKIRADGVSGTPSPRSSATGAQDEVV